MQSNLTSGPCIAKMRRDISTCIKKTVQNGVFSEEGWRAGGNTFRWIDHLVNGDDGCADFPEPDCPSRQRLRPHMVGVFDNASRMVTFNIYLIFTYLNEEDHRRRLHSVGHCLGLTRNSSH